MLDGANGCEWRDMMSDHHELVLFSHASPFHNPRELQVRYFGFNGVDLKIRQAWVSDGKGGTDIGFGSAVYEASFLMADYVSKNAAQLIDGKTVLELGCGVGLVSLVCALYDAAKIVATDGDAKSVSICKENIHLNSKDTKVNISSYELQWGDPCPDGTFDVILGSDIVCFPYKQSFHKLFQTLTDLSKPGSEIWIAHKPRDPVEDEFLEFLANHPLFSLKTKIPPQQLHPDFVHENISLYCFKRK